MLFDSITLNEGGKAINLTVDSGTAFPVAGNIGELYFRTDTQNLYQHDGITWVQIISANSVYDVALTIQSAVPTSTVIPGHVCVRGFTIPGDFAGSKAYAPSVPSAGLPGAGTFTLYKNGVSFGAIVFLANAGSFSTSGSAVSFAPGDVIAIGTPAGSFSGGVTITLQTTLSA